MINFFRRIRHRLLINNSIVKYTLYAIGEIVLVVIGILIALQINNWNQNKIEQATLRGYLTSISNNIKEDIEKIEIIKQKRINTITRIPYMFQTIGELAFLDIPDIKFASETINAISKLEYLNTDASGFESVKNSGYLSKLQGRDIENLIYKYYNLVQETERKEIDFNKSLQNAINIYNSETVEEEYYLIYPDYIGKRDKLMMLQPALKELIFHPSNVSLYAQTSEKGPELIVNYENLDILGSEIVRMIDNEQQTFDTLSVYNLNNIFDLDSKTGYAKLLINGALNSAYYEIGVATVNNQSIEGIQGINEINFNIPALEWATVYLRNPSNVQADRPIKDFSSYKSIQLELKSDKEEATVFINLKDDEDPDDGSETMIPLILSSDWNTYEIELSKFKTANLEELFVVAGFVFHDHAQKFSIRNIAYVK